MNRLHIVTIALIWIFLTWASSLFLLIDNKASMGFITFIMSSPGIGLLFVLYKFPPARQDSSISIYNTIIYNNIGVIPNNTPASEYHPSLGEQKVPYQLPRYEALPEPEYIEYEGLLVTIEELILIQQAEQEKIKGLKVQLAKEEYIKERKALSPPKMQIEVINPNK